ncbi:NAD(P)/FAD-dependent oxidoreductase [Tardiphaga sp. 619_E2_N8_5]
MTMERVVIVGGGQAGSEAAASLRGHGFAGSITIVQDETSLPYQRPPLSKGFLKGEVNAERLCLRPNIAYQENRIEVVTGVAVAAIDRAGNTVLLSDKRCITFDHLILATGGTPRKLEHPAVSKAPNVHCLRTIDDAGRLKREFGYRRRLVIIGGGYIGLEVAAVAARAGMEVTVLEASSRLLSRVTSEPVSAFYARVHREEGVDVKLGAAVADYVTTVDGRISAIRLRNGEEIASDAVLIGIGLVPNDKLAMAADLRVSDGIVVDDLCRTADHAIFAIGDCSRHPDPETAKLRRIESVPNAIEHARIVASVITGRPQPYEATPWFWSDQYDVKLKTVGLMQPTDQHVVRGNPDKERSFSVFYLRDGAIVAADVVSNVRDFAAARSLVQRRARIAPDQLANEAISLKELFAPDDVFAGEKNVRSQMRQGPLRGSR